MTDELEPVTNQAQVYQDARMAALPSIYKTAHEQMAYELALEIDEPAAVFARHGIDEGTAMLLLESPSFTAILARVSKDVKEAGLSFKAKARMMAETLLATGFEIATDPLAPTSERVKLIAWTAKVGGLEPTAKDEVKGSSGGLNLTIQFANQPPVEIVAHQPLTLENQA